MSKNVVKKRFLLSKSRILIYAFIGLLIIFIGLLVTNEIEQRLVVNPERSENSLPGRFRRGISEDEPVGIYKPVIYLYPIIKTNVEVKVNYPQGFLSTFPIYNNGWNVMAFPNGKLTNQADGQEYSYLFWEGNPDPMMRYDMTMGFVVPGKDTGAFLQDNLKALGLLPKEYNEMIVYWLPKMESNPYNLIHFATKEEYDDKAKLEITPKPDSVLRVFMVYKAVNEKVVVIPQELKSFTRKGFAVVEWGGTEVK